VILFVLCVLCFFVQNTSSVVDTSAADSVASELCRNNCASVMNELYLTTFQLVFFLKELLLRLRQLLKCLHQLHCSAQSMHRADFSSNTSGYVTNAASSSMVGSGTEPTQHCLSLHLFLSLNMPTLSQTLLAVLS